MPGFKPLSVYEGSAEIRTAVIVPQDAKPGAVKFTLTVQAQACDHAACLDPQTLELPLTITVKP